MSIKVSVIIPVYNEEKYIEDCLKSLIHQTEKPDEIIIVDNNSTDKTVEIAKKYPVKIVYAKEQGITPARNMGFNAAKYEILARTDADSRVPVTWIARIKKLFTDNPDIVALSGPAKFTDIPKIKQKAYWQANLLYFRLFKRLLKQETLFGPNLALRTSAWKLVKNDICLSDKIVHEDTDLSIHIGYLGEILFVKNLVVSSSARRWKRLYPHFEYPYRYLRTIQHHKQSLHVLKTGTTFITKRMKFPQSKRIVKRIKNYLPTARTLQKYL